MEAFENIYEEHFREIYRYVHYMLNNQRDAEDVTQEVFIKVARSYHDFRGESSLSTWIYSIARRTTIDFIRKKNTKKYLMFWKNAIPEEFDAPDTAQKNEQTLEQREQHDILMNLVHELPEKMKSVIYLRFMKEYTVQEIALLLEMTPNQVSVTQNRALAKLREKVEKNSGLKEELL